MRSNLKRLQENLREVVEKEQKKTWEEVLRDTMDQLEGDLYDSYDVAGIEEGEEEPQVEAQVPNYNVQPIDLDNEDQYGGLTKEEREALEEEEKQRKLEEEEAKKMAALEKLYGTKKELGLDEEDELNELMKKYFSEELAARKAQEEDEAALEEELEDVPDEPLEFNLENAMDIAASVDPRLGMAIGVIDGIKDAIETEGDSTKKFAAFAGSATFNAVNAVLGPIGLKIDRSDFDNAMNEAGNALIKAFDPDRYERMMREQDTYNRYYAAPGIAMASKQNYLVTQVEKAQKGLENDWAYIEQVATAVSQGKASRAEQDLYAQLSAQWTNISKIDPTKPLDSMGTLYDGTQLSYMKPQSPPGLTSDGWFMYSSPPVNPFTGDLPWNAMVWTNPYLNKELTIVPLYGPWYYFTFGIEPSEEDIKTQITNMYKSSFTTAVGQRKFLTDFEKQTFLDYGLPEGFMYKKFSDRLPIFKQRLVQGSAQNLEQARAGNSVGVQIPTLMQLLFGLQWTDGNQSSQGGIQMIYQIVEPGQYGSYTDPETGLSIELYNNSTGQFMTAAEAQAALAPKIAEFKANPNAFSKSGNFYDSQFTGVSRVQSLEQQTAAEQEWARQQAEAQAAQRKRERLQTQAQADFDANLYKNVKQGAEADKIRELAKWYTTAELFAERHVWNDVYEDRTKPVKEKRMYAELIKFYNQYKDALLRRFPVEEYGPDESMPKQQVYQQVEGEGIYVTKPMGIVIPMLTADLFVKYANSLLADQAATTPDGQTALAGYNISIDDVTTMRTEYGSPYIEMKMDYYLAPRGPIPAKGLVEMKFDAAYKGTSYLDPPKGVNTQTREFYDNFSEQEINRCGIIQYKEALDLIVKEDTMGPPPAPATPAPEAPATPAPTGSGKPRSRLLIFRRPNTGGCLCGNGIDFQLYLDPTPSKLQVPKGKGRKLSEAHKAKLQEGRRKYQDQKARERRLY